MHSIVWFFFFVGFCAMDVDKPRFGIVEMEEQEVSASETSEEQLPEMVIALKDCSVRGELKHDHFMYCYVSKILDEMYYNDTFSMIVRVDSSVTLRDGNELILEKIFRAHVIQPLPKEEQYRSMVNLPSSSSLGDSYQPKMCQLIVVDDLNHVVVIRDFDEKKKMQEVVLAKAGLN